MSIKQEMCSSAVQRKPCTLVFVPDHFKTQEIHDKAVKDDPSFLQFVPDSFVTQEQIKIWHYDGDHWDDDNDEDKFFEWYDAYKKRKVQKVSIKEEPLPIA